MLPEFPEELDLRERCRVVSTYGALARDALESSRLGAVAANAWGVDQ